MCSVLTAPKIYAGGRYVLVASDRRLRSVGPAGRGRRQRRLGLAAPEESAYRMEPRDI